MAFGKEAKESMFVRARRHLLLDHVFFGAMVMHLQPVEDPGADRGLWVDGEHVGFNPQVFDALDLPEAAGLLAKGVLHCALLHPYRRGSRDEETWQKAVDAVTSPMIIDSGLALPGGAVDRTYAQMTAEQAYELLEQQAQQQQPQGGQGKQQGQGGGGSAPQSGPGSPQGGAQPQQPPTPQAGGQPQAQPQTGRVKDAPVQSPAQAQQQERDWKINAQQAAQTAQGRGHIPGSLQAAIKDTQAPVVSWRDELREYMQSTAKTDQTWSRPNRRFIGGGLYLPALHSERMQYVVVVNDTSGSTSAAQPAFLAEMQAICEDLNPEHILYVQQDAVIAKVDELDAGDEFPHTYHGGGGTDFRPVFKMLEEQGITPDCMVFLTDLDGPFPVEPDYPVVWASVARAEREAPFGKTVHIDLSQR